MSRHFKIHWLVVVSMSIACLASRTAVLGQAGHSHSHADGTEH